MKTTSKGREIKILKDEYLGNHWTISVSEEKKKWRQHQMEDDLKMLKVEYLSNHWTDLPQILSLSLRDHIKVKFLKWKRPSIKYRFAILRWMCQQQLVRSSSNLKLKLKGPYQNKKVVKWRQPPMWDYLSICDIGGK